MKTTKTIIAVTAAAALSLAMAGAVTAGPPTVHGYLICDAYGQTDYPIGPEQKWARRDIAAYKRTHPHMKSCAGGSIEVVETTE